MEAGWAGDSGSHGETAQMAETGGLFLWQSDRGYMVALWSPSTPVRIDFLKSHILNTIKAVCPAI